VVSIEKQTGELSSASFTAQPHAVTLKQVFQVEQTWGNKPPSKTFGFYFLVFSREGRRSPWLLGIPIFNL